jgi:hypothetical protein
MYQVLSVQAAHCKKSRPQKVPIEANRKESNIEISFKKI